MVSYQGNPLKEPIVSHGPFVLSSEDEMEQTFDDFYSSKNGFEGAKTWKSKIKDLKYKKQWVIDKLHERVKKIVGKEGLVETGTSTQKSFVK